MKRFNKVEAIEITKEVFSRYDMNDDYEVADANSDLEDILIGTFGDKKSVRNYLSGEGQKVILTIIFNVVTQNSTEAAKQRLFNVMFGK